MPDTTQSYSGQSWVSTKKQAREILHRCVRRKDDELIPYSELAQQLAHITFDLHREPDHTVFRTLLDELSRESEARGRGMLSALVVLKDERQPGRGFFTLARELGRDVTDEAAFWSEEAKRVIARSRPPAAPS